MNLEEQEELIAKLAKGHTISDIMGEKFTGLSCESLEGMGYRKTELKKLALRGVIQRDIVRIRPKEAAVLFFCIPKKVFDFEPVT